MQINTWHAWYWQVNNLKIIPDYAVTMKKIPSVLDFFSLKHSSVYKIWSFVGLQVSFWGREHQL